MVLIKVGHVENCVNYATITYNKEGTSSSDYWAFGGIVGKNSSQATVINCANYGNITAPYVAGGISGNNRVNSEINGCINYGNVDVVESSGSGNDSYIVAGGIVARNSFKEKGTVKNCVNAGRITCTVTKSYVGGIVGIIGTDSGESAHSIIENCYNRGTLSGGKKALGGVLGLNITGATNEMKNNYWLSTCGATAGRGGGGNDGATKKTGDELKGLAATLGTAFTNDKVPNINSGYPILKWQ